MEAYGPYQVMLNVDGISIYTGTYVTTDSDQMGQIYLGQEERGQEERGQMGQIYLGQEEPFDVLRGW